MHERRALQQPVGRRTHLPGLDQGWNSRDVGSQRLWNFVSVVFCCSHPPFLSRSWLVALLPRPHGFSSSGPFSWADTIDWTVPPPTTLAWPVAGCAWRPGLWLSLLRLAWPSHQPSRHHSRPSLSTQTPSTTACPNNKCSAYHRQDHPLCLDPSQLLLDFSPLGLVYSCLSPPVF